jgi:hypothetical protein
MIATANPEAAQRAAVETEKSKQPLLQRPLRQTMRQLDESIHQIGMAPGAELACLSVGAKIRDGLLEQAFARGVTGGKPNARGERATAFKKPEELLESDEYELQTQVKVLAGLCADLVKGMQLRSPESWAGEFLHLPMNADDKQGYFERASRNAYAKADPLCAQLVTVAAAYAWKLRERDRNFTVPGTLNHTLSKLGTEDRAEWAHHTAAFQVHSYDLEGVSLPRKELEASLVSLVVQ